MFHTPYGMEFLDLADQKRVIIVGLAARTPGDDLYGWPAFIQGSRSHFRGALSREMEGDSLVVDTVGFNEKFWLTREGIP